MAPSTSSTTTSLVGVVAVILLFLPASSATDQSIMAPCKTVCGGNGYVSVEFCIEALTAAGGAKSPGYRSFAGLAVGLLAGNASSTVSKIDRLLRGNGAGVKDPAAVARCLQSCRSLYGGIVNGGPTCTAAVKAGKFADAKAILEKAAAATKECEDGFGKNNVSSPLSVEDDDAFKLAKLAVGMLQNL